MSASPSTTAKLEAIALVAAAVHGDEASFGAFTFGGPVTDELVEQYLAMAWLARDALMIYTNPDEILATLTAALVTEYGALASPVRGGGMPPLPR